MFCRLPHRPAALALLVMGMVLNAGGVCQAAGAEAPAPRLSALAGSANNDEARLLNDSRFWPGADRVILSGKQGLLLQDSQGATLSSLPGRYQSLDLRSDAGGMLVSALDKTRQQPMLVRLDGASRQWENPRYLPAPAFNVEGSCLFRDRSDNSFLFLIGDKGVAQQWLVAQGARLLATPRKVRDLSMPPQSEYCQTDDSRALLYVNEDAIGLWAYDAEAEAPLRRRPVDIRQPFGSIDGQVAGMAVLPDAVLALDPKSLRLHRYRYAADGWQADGALPLPGLKKPQALTARATTQGAEIIIADKRGLHQGGIDWSLPASTPLPLTPVLPAQLETEPVSSLGDAADDPAIWVNPVDGAASRILATDKQRGLLVYDLQGRKLQDLPVGRLNNVDLRAGLQIDGKTVDLAVASNRDNNSLHLFSIAPHSGEVAELGQIATPLPEIYGLCMFKDRQGAIYAIVNDKSGRFLQYRLQGERGAVRGQVVREFSLPSQPEGCVADDRQQRLFVGEEDVAVHALDARPDQPARLQQVIATGGALQADIEGMALYQGRQHSYLVISSQGNSRYLVLDALPPYTLRGAFHIGLNAEAGIDGASETDGLDVTSANLGGPWRQGMLVVQDGRNRMPEQTQNYKYLPWSAIAAALKLAD
ncbi:phytase [Affinibrenneria salicis]|uniref:Phytase n=1 Tax=Affinibrenneria salicis TaxID=2590031 RepID=A0A5J5FYM1_9GAMM|nr:phytase [Affinibrenneria salicis]KAA8998858.1 phytase [Affinibrenneria salicis]